MKHKKAILTMGLIAMLFFGMVALALLGNIIGQFVTRSDIPKRIFACKTAIAIEDGADQAEERPSFFARLFTEDLSNKLGELLDKFCTTIDVDTPKKKLIGKSKATKRQVMKNIADRMVDQREMVGDTEIVDPYKRGESFIDNCDAGFLVHVHETTTFEQGDKITAQEFNKFLLTETHSTIERTDNCAPTGGHCLTEQECGRLQNEGFETKDNKVCQRKGFNEDTICCFSEFGCQDKGGTCDFENPNEDIFVAYNHNDWDCPGRQTCYVPEKNHLTYEERLQDFKGTSNVYILTDIEPESTYTISWGAPNTDECGGLCNNIAALAGVGTAGAVIYGVLAIGTGGISLVVSAIPIAIIAGTGVGVATHQTTEIAYESVSEAVIELFKRNVPTLYVMNLQQTQDLDQCRIT